MKKNFARKLFSMIALFLIPMTLFSYFDSESMSKEMNRLKAIDIGGEGGHPATTAPEDRIGYGYNVASGIPLYSPTSLLYNYPILDVKNPELRSKIVTKPGTEAEPEHYITKSVQEMAESHATKLGGNLGLHTKIYMISVDPTISFKMDTNQLTGEVVEEEFSYYTYKAGNVPVYIQNPDDLSKYLDPHFKKDVESVNSEQSAIELMKKYGTHLPTGLIIGGLFEMTNYYATDSTTYVKEDVISFDAQVALAASQAKDDPQNASFSFTTKYGNVNNNKHAVNKYHCKQYGGCLFENLTIDQAFSTLGGLKEDYGYSKWLKSIDAGESTVIIGIPEQSELIPVWDLLPVNVEFNSAKEYLIKAYSKMVDTSYTNYCNKHPDRYMKEIHNIIKEKTSFNFVDNGFTYSTSSNDKLCSSHIDSKQIPTTEFYPVANNSYIYMDYNQEEFNGENVKWTLGNASESNIVEIVDERNGIFHVNNKLANQDAANFTVKFFANGVERFSRKFKFNSLTTSGGDGSEQSPYLISNPQEFAAFTGDASKRSKYIKLIQDIDLTGLNVSTIGGGDDDYTTNSFTGEFDGGNHVIKNFNPSTKAKSLFYANNGKIKNLTVSFDKASPKEITGGTGVVGGIVAVNDSSGIIDNCTVENFDIRHSNTSSTRISNNDSRLGTNVYIGGIAALNKGQISNCLVRNSSIVSNVVEEANYIMVGGIAGKCQKEGKYSEIVNCQVEGTSFDIQLSKGGTDDSVNVGGLVGRIEQNDFVIDNCIVRKATPAIDHTEFNIYAKNNANGVTRIYRYVGGLVGACKGNTTISHCVVSDNLKINDMTEKNSWFSVALAVGHQGKGAKVIFNQCYIENSDSVLPNLFQTQKENVDGIQKIAVFSNDTFGPDFNTGWKFTEDGMQLNLKRVNLESLTVDTSLTKTKFYLNEQFSYNNLKVNGYYTNSDSFEETALYIDSRSYNPNKTGNYPIYVYCLGEQLSYTVSVGKAPINKIIVKELSSKTYYIKDSNFDTSTIEVTAVLNDGTKEIIPYDSTGQNGYTFSCGPKGFTLGKSEVIIKYHEFEYKFYVKAIEREIQSIEIIDKSSVKAEYEVESRNITDFSNIEIKITYTDGGTKTVKGSECDFIYSKIHEGINKVDVIYDMKHKASFTVKGKFNIDMNLVNEFIRLVNEINTNGTMKEQFDSINLARAQLAKIDTRYYGEENYQAAKVNLQTAIDDYNAKVDSINKGFKDTVEISESFNVQLATAAGLTTLAAIVGYVIKKHL